MEGEPLSEKGFERKLKRLVIGREHRWLASVQKPFASIAFNELTALGAGKPELSGEGVRFFSDLTGIYTLHLLAKTVSRFWLIVDTFPARSREELFAKVSRIPWELFLNAAIPVRTRSMVRRSAVRHEGETAETVSRAIGKRLASARLPVGELQGAPPSDRPPRGISVAGGVPDGGKEQLVEACVIDNRCELRLDASGAHLHKRGYRALPGAAPIRETPAAALLRWAVEKKGMPGLFLDPMCGSGTFPIEMWGLSRGVSLAGRRNYAFMEWPGFRPRAWGYLERKIVGERAKAASAPPASGAGENQPTGAQWVLSGRYPLVMASDVSPRAADIAMRNAQSLGISGGIVFSTGDFFRLEGSTFPENPEIGAPGRGPRLLCVNPPYGKRLAVPCAGADGRGRGYAEAELYRRILSHIKAAFPGWRILMLVPRHAVPGDLADYFRVESLSFTNGGIPLLALLLEQKKGPVS